MKTAEFRRWLRDEYLQQNGTSLALGTQVSRVANCSTVEQVEGDLDDEFNSDGMRSLLDRLNFSSKDQAEGRKPKHGVRIEGDLVNGSTTYRSAVNLYRKFRVAQQSQPVSTESLSGDDHLVRYLANEMLTVTERQALVQSRVGQGRFRYLVLEFWDYRCAATGAGIMLYASHIKPWRDCDNRERLDGYNGLSLSPVFDRAFDLGLVTFDPDGTIHISPRISALDAAVLGISSKTKIPGLAPAHAPYLEYHQKKVWRRT